MDEYCLHLLSLALWAVEQGLASELGEQCVWSLSRIQEKNPARVFRILTGETEDGNEVSLWELPPTLEEAARVMLEQAVS